ncbi:MAG: hypothetical protein ABTR27_10035 [Candidatus Competibacter phosphatis]
MPPPPADSLHDQESSYMQQLRARSAEYEEQRRLKREIELKKLQMELAGLSSPPNLPPAKRKPLAFYAQQITAWFGRLPPEARKAPRTMEEFINLLQGRAPGMRAHAPDVSKVLSGLGWVRRRDWRADGGRRLWWPPV